MGTSAANRTPRAGFRGADRPCGRVEGRDDLTDTADGGPSAGYEAMDTERTRILYGRRRGRRLRPIANGL